MVAGEELVVRVSAQDAYGNICEEQARSPRLSNTLRNHRISPPHSHCRVLTTTRASLHTHLPACVSPHQLCPSSSLAHTTHDPSILLDSFAIPHS